MSRSQTKKQSKVGALWRRLLQRRKAFMQRRPHRSFVRTRRRDYARDLVLPGYISFTAEVARKLWRERRIFFWVALIFAVLSAALVGIGSQEVYTQLSDFVKTGKESVFNGVWGEVTKSSLLLISAVTGSLQAAPTATQQVYNVLLLLLAWLTTVWLWRALLTGARPRFRDGLYNAGAPIIPTMLVGLVAVLQLIPVSLAVIGYSAASGSEILSNGVEAMVFWSVAALLGLLSAYWLTSTALAMVIITLPGMYPMKAIRAAGDLVTGRRVRILLRLAWLALVIVVVWGVVMVPLMMFEGWLASKVAFISQWPIIPIILLCMSSVTVVWSASYVYLLYRKLVNDNAAN